MFGLDSFTFAQLWKPLELMIYIVTLLFIC